MSFYHIIGIAVVIAIAVAYAIILYNEPPE
jgi:hypothetical protein